MATLEQLEAALRAADAAGNTEDARRLAQAYAAARWQSAMPDFSNVQSQASTKSAATVNGERPDQMSRLMQAGYGAASPIASAITGIGEMTGLMSPERVAANTARIDAVRDTTSGKVGSIAGDIGLMAVPFSKVAALPKIAQYAASAGIGAGYAGIQPVREGESRGENAALGGLFGALGQGASHGLQAVGSRAAQAIKPEVRALYEAAKARGLTLTPAQLSDSRFAKFVESSLRSLPGSGVAAKAAQQKAAFNKELAKAIGVDAPVITPEVYASKKAADSAKFNELTARNELTVTGGLAQKLHQIQQESKLAGKEVHEAVTNAVEGLYSQMSEVGKVPGRAYQALDTALGQVTKLGTPVSHFVGQVKHAIRDAMDDSISPADKGAWDKLRKEYGNRKTLRDLVAKGDGGELSPAAIMARVTSNNAGKEAMASGTRGDLGTLARIGQRMKEPPSSGTAERQLAYSAFNPLMWAPLALGTAAGVGSRTVNNGALARLMMREGRGEGAQFLAPYVRGAGPLVIPATQKRRDGK